MEFLAASLLELITQTSTNLPPDVRAAMSLAAGGETPRTQPSQALEIILSNVDMAQEDEGPICPDTGTPTFVAQTPVGVNQICSDRAHGYDLAKIKLFWTLGGVNPVPDMAKPDHGRTETHRRGHVGFCAKTLAAMKECELVCLSRISGVRVAAAVTTSHIKELTGPLPQLEQVPTGSTNLEMVKFRELGLWASASNDASLRLYRIRCHFAVKSFDNQEPFQTSLTHVQAMYRTIKRHIIALLFPYQVMIHPNLA
jgi:hypothetical protein